MDVVSENIPSWHGLCFVLHGHRLCRDIAVVLIASIEIWIPDILSYFYRETGNWRFTGSEIRSIPYPEGGGGEGGGWGKRERRGDGCAKCGVEFVWVPLT